MLLVDFNSILNNAIILQEKLEVMSSKGFQDASSISTELKSLLNKESITDNIENLFKFVQKNQEDIFRLYDEYLKQNT